MKRFFAIFAALCAFDPVCAQEAKDFAIFMGPGSQDGVVAILR
jgi:hypothetical protein